MKHNTMEIAKKIFERYKKMHDIEHYFGQLAYYALAQIADYEKDAELLSECENYLNLYPDNFNHPQYNFEVYRVGGNPKAWMFLKGYMPKTADELREYAEITCNALQSKEGMISSPFDAKKIWIDSLFCIAPYMLYVGLALNEQKYIDFAVDQCFKFYDMFTDKTCGLLHQSRGFLENPERVSPDHWSRGNGWGYFALSELVQYIPEDSPYRERLIEYYLSHSFALVENQTPCGLWRQEIPEELAWYESSGSGLILYGLGIGLRLGILTDKFYRDAFEKGIEALSKFCLDEEFATYRSCCGCLSPGEGKEKGTVKAYLTLKTPETDEVHSYGCMMLAFYEAYRNGVREATIFENIWDRRMPK